MNNLGHPYILGESIVILRELINKTTGQRATGLGGVTISIWEPDGTLLINGAAMTEHAGVSGFYTYTLAGASVTKAGLHVFDINPNDASVLKNDGGTFMVDGGVVDLIKIANALSRFNVFEDKIVYDPTAPNRKTQSRYRGWAKGKEADVGTDDPAKPPYVEMKFTATYDENGRVKTMMLQRVTS